MRRFRTSQAPGWAGSTRGFTLLELLVVISIIALLLSVLIPSFVSVREQAKSILCMDHLRNTSTRFRLFADPYGHTDRGDSESYGNRFSMTDFLDSLYETDEFYTGRTRGADPKTYYPAGKRPVMCPAGPSELYKVPELSVIEGAVGPIENISYALNRRLLFAPKGNDKELVKTLVDDRVLNHPNVPLYFDTDGSLETKIEIHPTSILLGGPPQPNVNSAYKDGRYWHPSLRHRGKMNIAFIGGHVQQTRKPMGTSQWEWFYQPELSN